MNEANTGDTTTRSILRTLKDMGFVTKAPPFEGRRTYYELSEGSMYQYWLRDLKSTVEKVKEQINLPKEEKVKLRDEVREMPEKLETYYQTGPECLHEIDDFENISSQVENKIGFWTLQVASEGLNSQDRFRTFFYAYIDEYFAHTEESSLEDMFFRDMIPNVGDLEDSLVSQVLAIVLAEKYPDSNLSNAKIAFMEGLDEV